MSIKIFNFSSISSAEQVLTFLIYSYKMLYMQYVNTILIAKPSREEKIAVLIDYHMHSTYSADGEMTLEEACLRAIEIGIDEIAFTDHIDIDWPDPNINFSIINIEQYLSDITKLAEKYSHQIKIKKGIEIGLQPHVLEENSNIIQSYPFDFVIGSVHIIDRMDPYQGNYYEGKTKEESYRRYYQEIIDLIAIYDDFDVLGHLDYIRRYNPYSYSCEDLTLALDLIDEILKILIDKGKGIEVNTSGYRHISKCPLPSFAIVKRYRELGGEIITLGSDAHRAEYIGYKFKIAVEGIKEAGFKYLTTFQKRKPQFVKI